MITCPNCAKQNQDHYKFCLGCGSELPRDQVKAPVHMSTPTPPSGMPAVHMGAGGPAMMPAPAVAHQAPAPAAPIAAAPFMAQPAAPAPQYSPAPQAPQPAAAPRPAPQAAPAAAPAQPAAAGPKKCPSCGNDIPPGFKFCGRCGTPIVDGAPAAAAAPAPAPAAAPAQQVLGRIVMIQPDGSEGASLPITKDGTIVGRAAGTPMAEDFFLSAKHAKFSFTSPGVLQVEDTGSLNGIYRRLIPEQAYPIAPGDMLRVGQEVIRFELLAPPKNLPDGTVPMGSPRKTAWGRFSLVVGKDLIGNSFLLEHDEVLIGRERGHIIFPEDGYVSGLHLKISKQGDTYQVVDVGSSNGSYLRVNRTARLDTGDYILVGQFLYKVEF